MKRILLTALLATSPLVLQAADEASDPMAARNAEIKATIQEFAGNLKGQLQAALKAGGPVEAIRVCNQVAPQLAAEMSERKGWSIGRTSLKERNAANAPDAWERAVLEKFEERKAAGEDVQAIAYAEVVEGENGAKEYRFMKAIPTGEVCLKCHGAELDPQVTATLDALYPNDQARGFHLGDIRGAFTIRQPM